MLELIKEELPKQVWGKISKKRFSSVDIRRGQRLPADISDKGGNMCNRISWYHSQHREKEKCPNAG